MAEQPPSPPESELPIGVAEIAAVARRFSDQKMYEESIRLYETAIRLDPDSLSLKIALARSRSLQKTDEKSRLKLESETFQSKWEKDDIDANHYIGLAEFSIAKRRTNQAIEMLEIAKIKNPCFYLPYKILAEVYVSVGDWDSAAEEIAGARRLNPFDGDIAELSGRLELQRKDHQKALDELLDGMLLLGDRRRSAVGGIRRNVHFLKRILNLENDGINSRLKERLRNLEEETRRLERAKDTLLEGDARFRVERIIVKKAREGERRENLLGLAAELRQSPALSHFEDEEVFRVAQAVRVEDYGTGSTVFSITEDSFDFFLVLSGRIRISVETPVGVQEILDIEPNRFVGEISFIDKNSRPVTAIAEDDTRLLAFNFTVLESILADTPDIAANLYWAFWRSLSVKLRAMTNILATFFDTEAGSGGGRQRSEEKAERPTQTVSVAVNEKMDLLRERGLSANELHLLATFSIEETYTPGALIFPEGEVGDKLYIVLDGSVRISKYIPGVGEEALAILRRGEFFGEMALIEDKPRSADARAHDTGATVLAITQTTLNEVLAMDPAASHQFLDLLCVMICRRSREILSKIISWRTMAGG